MRKKRKRDLRQPEVLLHQFSVLPWHSKQVLQQGPVLLRLGPLPTGRGLEGEHGPAPPVPAAREDGQLLLEDGHDVDGAEAVKATRT